MLDEMRTFIAVVEHKSFTKAAKSINLSQPSVSLHIKRLEEYFNTVLIQRSVKQKNIIITQSGRLLFERCKQIILLLEETKEELNDYSNNLKGKLRIGASFTIGEYFLPAFLGEFSKDYPELELEVIIENTSNICSKVENLEIDLGLIEGMIPSSNFKYGHFYEDKMVLAVPYEHPLSKKKFCSKFFENQRWVTREKGSGTREYLDVFLNANNIVPKNIVVLGSNYAVKEAVKNKLGVTFTSYYIAKEATKNKELSIIDIEQKYTRYFSYIFNNNSMPTSAIKAFINKLNNINRI